MRANNSCFTVDT